jgi:RND family efflux transporter MFP subunit
MVRQTLKFAVLLAACAIGCDRFESEEERERERAIGAAAPAPNAPSGTVRVSQQSQQSIDIRSQEASLRKVNRTLPTVGWLTTKVGSEVVIKAPTAGFIRPPAGQTTFEIGAAIANDAPLGTLEVFLSPQEQAQLISAKEEADTVMNQALVTMQLAEGQLERLKSARDAAAGTRLLDLEEILRKARVAYEEGRDRLPFLPEEPYTGGVKLKPIDLRAPLAGRVLQVHASPRQLVSMGDPLWTIADWHTLWLRVPVFQTDLGRVALDQPTVLSLPGTSETLRAERLELPQATNLGERTIDLFYELPNPNEILRPGQAVSVSLPLAGASDGVIVPKEAILWDGMGSAWVYVRAGPEEFRRKRVEVGQHVGHDIVVERGLAAGEEVVTVGVQAIYGQEFKGDLQTVDED